MGKTPKEVFEAAGQCERAVRLLRYLQEFVKLRSKIVRSIDQYAREGFVQWLADMPQERGCTCPLWADAGEDGPWLEVHKQSLPSPPELPALLEPWVEREGYRAPLAARPSLLSNISVEIEAERGEGGPNEAEGRDFEVQRLEDHPEVSAAWEGYLPRWKAWAAASAPKAKIQRIYSELFRAYQMQQRLGEAYEFVVGFGLLSAKSKDGKQPIHRHVLVARAELRFEKRRGVITIECPPPPEGAALRIEDDFLEPQEQPTKEEYEIAREQIAEIGDAVWDRVQMNAFLRGWANTLYANVEYSEDLTAAGSGADTPRMGFAPALILRKRRITGILATYALIIEQIEGSGQVPFGFRRLIDHLEDRRGPHEGDVNSREDGGFEDPRVLFPLPANNEQREIVQELGKRRGVLVQGPPGTGKSQTIANLLCHFLALGKRVLVTSETARALAVLKEKIPATVQPLCVSLLGADTASFAELERSINGIGRKYAQWKPDSSEQLIQQQEERLEAQRERRAEVERELRTLRESETHLVTVGNGQYRGTAAAIARQVNERRELHGWLELPDSAPEHPPLIDDEALQLLRGLRRIDESRREELTRSFPELTDVPTAPDLAGLIEAERKAHEHAESFEAAQQHQAYRPILEASAERRSALEDMLSRFVEERRTVQQRPEPWTEKALEHVLKEREAAWKVRLERTRDGLEELRGAGPRAAEVAVRLPEEVAEETVLADASDMLAHLRSGGRWSILGIPTSPARGKAYLRKQVRVDGRHAGSQDALEALVFVLETRRRLRRAWAEWAGYASPTDSGIETQVAELDEHVEALEMAFELLRSVREASTLFEQEPRIPKPDWTSDEPERLQGVVTAVGARLAARQARAASETALEKLNVQEPTAHPVNHRMAETLRRRDLETWKVHHEELASLHRDQEAWAAAVGLLNRLKDGAPEVAEALERRPESEEWEDRLRRFTDAWAWAITDRWLQQREDETRYRSLVEEVEDLHRGESKATELLAAELAWQDFLGRLSQKEKESLEAWQLAVKQVGKGTGKHAEKHRAEARRYMAACIHSIPAWIVPRYRVAEVLQPEPELFDVVIVDEASQTGIDGLFLYYLGKQTIIVGDHQQISPAGVGVPETSITELQRRYVDDFPFKAALQPTASLYAHAKIKFQGRTVLREHFRCMPEIIQFSNDLCYAPHGAPLIPLRTYPPDRLEPVVTRFVSGGYQEGKASHAVNRPEAKALVAQILACVKDPRYRRKSFGVISLLGTNQARFIQELLTHHLGPEVMEERALICGDAYAFQGDERDIMFLSMVSAPNARIGALATEAAHQRFNVAASRARDQMWLFHSVRPEDLSDKGVRRRLLDYCLNPHRSEETGEDRFESELERDVCAAIRGRGYRVVTQVPAGDQTSHRYRIDLVVEGMTHRLAVECDGDAWHGPDRYEADMARQRQLERAGWQFVRIRDSVFRRDRERALEPLWEALERLGIEPQGAEPAGPVPLPEPEAIPDLEEPAGMVFTADVEEEGEQATSGIDIPSVEEDLVGPEPEAGSDRPTTRPRAGTSAERIGDSGSRPPEAARPQAEPRGITRKRRKETRPSRPKDYSAEEEHRDRVYLEALPANELLELSHWAKEKGVLHGWQRGVLYTVGKYKHEGREPSVKQVRRAAEAHREAVELGFRPEPSKQPDLFESELDRRIATLNGGVRSLARAAVEEAATLCSVEVEELLDATDDPAAASARILAVHALALRRDLSPHRLVQLFGFRDPQDLETTLREARRLQVDDDEYGSALEHLLRRLAKVD